MRAGDVVRFDFGTPARREPGYVRPAIIVTDDAMLEVGLLAVNVVPCTTTDRPFARTDIPIEGLGQAQAHNIATISVDRIVEETTQNVGVVALAQIREVVALVLGIG
jgi:mRNA-degrading endonuclease toxin of MazEF toxin-antitoxin module